MILQGVSGAIDQLIGQPFMGIFLNLFNRLVVNRLDALHGSEVAANLALAALGCLLLTATRQTARARDRSG